jgi:hypothetical protein
MRRTNVGANFVCRVYQGGKDKVRNDFEKDQEQDRYENGHSYSGGIGMAKGISFLDYQTYTEEEAEQWLEDHTVKWENALAVRVRDSDKWVVGALCAC